MPEVLAPPQLSNRLLRERAEHAADLLRTVRAATPADPSQPALTPGDPQREHAPKRLPHGVPVDARTADVMSAPAPNLGVPGPRAVVADQEVRSWSSRSTPPAPAELPLNFVMADGRLISQPESARPERCSCPNNYDERRSMDVLDIDLETTPIAPTIRELDASSDWEAIDQNNLEQLVATARRLVSTIDDRSDGYPLTADLRVLLARANSPWGLAILHNLPTQDDPRRSFLLLAELMGRVVRFEDEGDYVIEIKEDPRSVVGGRPAFTNAREFFPHTDLSYIDEPPVFFCLHSINNDERQGGLSEFVDVAEIAKSLEPHQINILGRPDFLFPAPKHFRGGSAVRKPILSPHHAGPDQVRFRRDNLRCATREGIDAVVALCRKIQQTMIEVFLTPGSVAVIDNKRVLHGRTAFLGGAAAKIPRHINRLYFDVDPGEDYGDPLGALGV